MADPRPTSEGATIASVAWAISPLLLGVPSAVVIGYAAARLRSRALWTEAGALAVLTVGSLLLTGLGDSTSTANNLGSAVVLLLMVGTTLQALVLRPRVFTGRGLTGEPPAPGRERGLRSPSARQDRSASLD